ncbi:MAG: ankyrin repeat domain-containing protein [Pseudomonadota bacterium]|nr:ankyrin repeat domain-containing protein [Pseudomonadota bacterium]
MKPTNNKCIISFIEVTSENFREFVLIRSLNSYYFINTEAPDTKDFFMIRKCPLNRNKSGFLIVLLNQIFDPELISMILNCQSNQDFDKFFVRILDTYTIDRKILNYTKLVKAENDISDLPLHNKIINNMQLTVKEVKEVKNSINYIDKNNYTALDYALSLKKLDYISPLLEFGAVFSQNIFNDQVISNGNFNISYVFSNQHKNITLGKSFHTYKWQSNFIRQSLMSEAKLPLIHGGSLQFCCESLLYDKEFKLFYSIINSTKATDITGVEFLKLSIKLGANRCVNKILKENLFSFENNKQTILNKLLEYAIRFNNNTAIRTLIHLKADIYGINIKSENNLTLAIKYSNDPTLNLVLKYFDINMLLRSKQKRQLYDILFNGTKNHTNSVVLYLMGIISKNKVNLDKLDGYGKNILCQAIESNNIEVFNYLMSNDLVDIEQRVTNGLTAIFYTFIVANPFMLDALIKKGANLYLKSDNGYSLLTFAMRARNKELLKILCDKIDISKLGCNLDVVIKYCLERGYEDIVIELINLKPSCCLLLNLEDLLYTACKYESVNIVDRILIYNNPLNNFVNATRQSTGKTPLQIALDNENTKIVELLIIAGATIESRDIIRVNKLLKENLKFWSPLYEMALKKQEFNSNYINHHSVKENNYENNRILPMHLAAAVGNNQFMTSFLQNSKKMLLNEEIRARSRQENKEHSAIISPCVSIFKKNKGAGQDEIKEINNENKEPANSNLLPKP